MGSIVSTPQAVESHWTINKSIGDLRRETVLCRPSQSTRSRSCQRGCATAWEGWEVTLAVTVHDKKYKLRQKEAGGGPLRHEFRARYEMICNQEDINESKGEGRAEFKFTCSYKHHWGSSTTTLAHLIFKPVKGS